MAVKKKKQTFEERTAELEAMIERLGGGGLSLEESIQTYSAGMALLTQLEAELAAHRRQIEQLDAETAQITPLGEEA